MHEQLKKLTKYTVIRVLAIWVGVNSFMDIFSIYAKQSAKEKGRTQLKWRYCAISNPSYVIKDNNYLGVVKVYYFHSSDYKEESFQFISSDLEIAKAKAFAIAIAKLGADGWEIAGESGIITFRATDKVSLFFKISDS